MGLFDRVGRIVRANLNSVVSAAEDPEKILNQTIDDMQEDLIQLRQAVATAIASQKRMERQYEQALSSANEWQRKAELALRNNNEGLAREALVRKKSFTDSAQGMKQQLDQQTAQVDALKSNMMKLESKISEAKTRKDMLIARARSAKATEQINQVIGRTDTSSAFAAFERMEEKVVTMESKAEAIAELATDSLDSQFAALEAGGSNVDDELAALRRSISGGAPEPQALPTGSVEMNAELEALKAELDR